MAACAVPPREQTEQTDQQRLDACPLAGTACLQETSALMHGAHALLKQAHERLDRHRLRPEPSGPDARL